MFPEKYDGFACFFFRSVLFWQARVSLTRIGVFLSRNDIEGQGMNVHVDGAGGGHSRAPAGGLLVRHGTFAWPVVVSFVFCCSVRVNSFVFLHAFVGRYVLNWGVSN